MLLLHLVPATEDVFHRQQLHFRKVGLVFVRDGRVSDAVAIAGKDILALGRVEEIEIGLGEFARAVLVSDLVDDGNREFGEQADRGGDLFELVVAILLADAARLGLEGDQHVADLALHEGGGGRAAACVENRHVVEELGDKLLHLGVVIVEGLLGVGGRGQIGVARVARGLRVGEDHLHVVAHQVVPVLDVLGVARADQE